MTKQGSKELKSSLSHRKTRSEYVDKAFVMELSNVASSSLTNRGPGDETEVSSSYSGGPPDCCYYGSDQANIHLRWGCCDPERVRRAGSAPMVDFA